MLSPIYEWTDDTPAELVFSAFDRIHACQEGIDWLKALGETRWGDVVDRWLADPDSNQGWAVYWLVLFGADSSPKLLQKFIAKIVDPMMAFMVYLRVKCLTKEHDLLLEAKFKGKLPRAEKELAEGIVSRRKTA